MTNNQDRPHNQTWTEVQNLLSERLIANLATLNDDGSIHLVPMWFLRVDNDIYIPTSYNTRKYKNLRKKPHASVMIDRSQAGLNLKGVLIMGQVELIYRQEARLSFDPFEVRKVWSTYCCQSLLVPFLVMT